MPVDRSVLTKANCCATCEHSKLVGQYEEYDYYCKFFDGKFKEKIENRVEPYEVCPFFEMYNGK
jgi:hypothetical protein